MISDDKLSQPQSEIFIRPFVEKGKLNMGLERYEQVLFEGCFHEETLSCLESNGIKRYLTGLDEFAPEIKRLPTEERVAKVKQIRATVAELEKVLAGNVLDVESADFWKDVQILTPKNYDFWETVKVKLGNEPTLLDTNNPIDIIKLAAIEAGGFSIIAKDLETARKMAIAPKFYLDKREDTATYVTEPKKLYGRCQSELMKLYDKMPNKMFMICKVFDINGTQLKKTTSPDVVYNYLYDTLDGTRGESRNLNKTHTMFLDLCAQNMEVLTMRAIIRDGSHWKKVHTKADGFIYHTATNTMMGKNPSDVLEFLKNPLNEAVLRELQDEVEQIWKR